MLGYKPGTRVSYADDSATVSDGVTGVSSGVVNGPPLLDDDGEPTHVPVFTERDNGREATTVWVAVENLLGETG